MGFDAPCARPLSGGLPGRRSGTPPAQAPPLHPATDRSGSVPSWVKSERRMADIGILSTTNNTNPHPQGDMRLRMASRRTRDSSWLNHRGQRALVLRDADPSGSAPQDEGIVILY